MKQFFQAAVTAIALLSVVPATPALAQQQLSGLSARDKEIGARDHKEIIAQFGGAMSGPLSDYVQRVGLKVALQSVPGSAAKDWTITLLNSPVPNAMATPGGYLYITRGLLAMMNSEAELASVLGHEAGHVAARHSHKRQNRATIAGLGTLAASLLGGGDIAQIVNMGGAAWVSGYSRSQENEADSLGLRYSARAGYDPRAAASMLAGLERVQAVEGKEAMERGGLTSIFSSHPVTSSRIQRVSNEARKMPNGGALNERAFLSAINGMTYGDSPDQGIVSGPSFRHAALRLAFDAPTGFTLQNTPQAVAGQASDGSNFVFQGVAAQQGQSLDSIVQQVWTQLNNGQTPTVQYSEQRVNNLNAAFSTSRASTRQGAVDVGVNAFRMPSGETYIIRTVAPAGRGQIFDSLLRSFRQLTPAEAQAANRPRRIEVVTVKAGDTIEKLAQRMAPPYNRAQSLMALNGIQNRALQPGEMLKLIVG